MYTPGGEDEAPRIYRPGSRSGREGKSNNNQVPRFINDGTGLEENGDHDLEDVWKLATTRGLASKNEIKKGWPMWAKRWRGGALGMYRVELFCELALGRTGKVKGLRW